MLLRTLIALGLSSILHGQTDTAAQGNGPEYGGPSILSRGMGASVLSKQKDIRIRPYIGVSGFCDNGLTAFTLSSSGQLPNKFACGVEGQAGLYGYHMWRKSQLSVEYSGNYRHYPQVSYYDGTDQLLSLGYAQRLSRHTELVLKESAGTYARNYQQPSAFGFYDPTALSAPNSLAFDNRLYYVQTGADFTYHPTARLSINLGGEFAMIRFRSTSLYGSTSESARGDMVYRYSRFGSIGAVYEFDHFRFRNVFGATDLHSIGLQYSVRMSQTVEFRARVGVTRVESLALQTVAVDPIIAAITGQTSGVQARYRLNYVPKITVSLSKRLPHGSFNIDYDRGVTPGNGVLITSAQEAASIGYSYTGVRHWNFGASGGYYRLSALLQTGGQYHSYAGGAGVTRDIGKGVNVLLRFDERRFDTGFANFSRNAFRATLGLTWSPGDVPLMLW